MMVVFSVLLSQNFHVFFLSPPLWLSLPIFSLFLSIFPSPLLSSRCLIKTLQYSTHTVIEREKHSHRGKSGSWRPIFLTVHGGRGWQSCRQSDGEQGLVSRRSYMEVGQRQRLHLVNDLSYCGGSCKWTVDYMPQVVCGGLSFFLFKSIIHKHTKALQKYWLIKDIMLFLTSFFYSAPVVQVEPDQKQAKNNLLSL